VVVVVGTDEDPQDFDHQLKQLKNAKVQLFTSNEAAVHHAGELVQALAVPDQPPVSLDIINQPLAALNVGLESFAEALADQGASVIHVDWKPPAGGNERLAAILARMRG
jgi:FdrA protein